MIDEPIGWLVSALPPPRDKLDGIKIEPMDVTYPGRIAADAHKIALQADGWIATVTPVFLSKQTRKKARLKLQERTAPQEFNKDWKLY